MALPPYTPDADNATQPLDTVSGGYAAREIRAVKTKLTTTKGIADGAAAVAGTALGAANAAQNTADGAESLASNNAACLGVSGDSDLGTFTGSIIPDDSTVKGALQVLETYLDAGGTPDATARARIDNLAAIIGRAYSDTHMGTFTGSLLPDAQSIKALLQVLETRVERTAQVFNCVLNGATGTPSGGVDGYTFSDMNDLLAAMPDNCTINVEVTDFTGTWNKIASPVTKINCDINIHINYYSDATKRGIVITNLDGLYNCTLVDCELDIHGENSTYSVIRFVAGTSNIAAKGINASDSFVHLSTLAVEFANSAAHALGCSFVLIHQATASAHIENVKVVWDSVFTPVPATDGIQVISCGIAGESWSDHDLDISYMEIAYPTTLYYSGRTNRKYVSAPIALSLNLKHSISLSATGRVMQNITSAMLKLTCTTADLNFAVGDELYFALGGSGTAEGNEKGAYLVGNRAGTKQIVEIWLFIAAQGLTHVRNTPPYNVELLTLANWSAKLYCRDEY